MFQRQQRYLDELNRAMLITALILTIIGMFFFQYGTWPRYVITGLATVLLVLLMLRLFSKDQSRRYRENVKFLAVTTDVKNWFRSTFKGGARTPKQPKTHRARKARKNPTWSEIKQYKYLICPQCTQRLRVPRGKGRIRVTCTRCGNVFETKS
ncbi:MAG TPA: zinc ribbon domain-containing protein [Eubacteriales bacterium]|nr:zinc ribbon domain-containing protein [Eubacteriales bacterium]